MYHSVVVDKLVCHKLGEEDRARLLAWYRQELRIVLAVGVGGSQILALRPLELDELLR